MPTDNGREEDNEVYINLQTILTIGSLLITAATIAGGLYACFKWFSKQEKQEKDIENIQKEQTVLCYGVMACLDGLKQLNCNGNVTKAHDRLEKHLNQAAHE